MRTPTMFNYQKIMPQIRQAQTREVPVQRIKIPFMVVYETGNLKKTGRKLRNYAQHPPPNAQAKVVEDPPDFVFYAPLPQKKRFVHEASPECNRRVRIGTLVPLSHNRIVACCLTAQQMVKMQEVVNSILGADLKLIQAHRNHLISYVPPTP